MMCDVIRGARQGRIFTCGKRGRDAYYGDRGGKEWVTQGGAIEVESLEFIEGGGVVGECLSRSAILS